MPRHNLYFMPLNCEDLMSSATFNEMSLAAQGAFIRMLAHAWLTDTCTLPAAENAVRRIVGPESDAQWAEVWPQVKKQYKKRGDRIYNKVQMDAFTKANEIYEKRRAARTKRVTKASTKGSTNTPTSDDTTDNRQQTVPESDNSTGTYRAPAAPRKCEAPVYVSEILETLTEDQETLQEELESIIGTSVYREGAGYLRWASVKRGELLREAMDIIRNGMTQESRDSKGCVKIEAPVAFIRAYIKNEGVMS